MTIKHNAQILTKVAPPPKIIKSINGIKIISLNYSPASHYLC